MPGVLIVEDEPLILADLEKAVTELGYRVAHKARNLVDGLIFARRKDVDVALLDVYLDGLTSAKIAAVLELQNIPFLVVTGHSAAAIPEPMRKASILRKPVDTGSLGKALRNLLSARPPPHPLP